MPRPIVGKCATFVARLGSARVTVECPRSTALIGQYGRTEPFVHACGIRFETIVSDGSATVAAREGLRVHFARRLSIVGVEE